MFVHGLIHSAAEAFTAASRQPNLRAIELNSPFIDRRSAAPSSFEGEYVFMGTHLLSHASLYSTFVLLYFSFPPLLCCQSYVMNPVPRHYGLPGRFGAITNGIRVQKFFLSARGGVLL